MLENIFDNIQRTDLLERRLRSLFEGKSWEHIAKALYQILDDISTTDVACKENSEVFRSIVMKLQAKKNAYLFSPDGHSLVLMNEAVATTNAEADLLKKHKSTGVGSLKKSTYSLNPTEMTRRKFWLLTNGKLVAVDWSHESVAEEAGTTSKVLHDEGAYAGYVVDNEEMGLRNWQTAFDFTSAQIITVKQLFDEYSIVRVIIDTDEKDFDAEVGSSKELSNILRYGTLDESKILETIADRVWDFLRVNPDSTFNEILDGIDATGEDAGKFEEVVKDMLNKSIYVEDGKYSIVESISNTQQKLKDFYKDRLNTPLKNSTFGKENYPKFWLLTDGTIIPVDHTHGDTTLAADVDYTDIEDEDGIGGYIEGKELGLPLSINQELTSAQKAAVKKLHNDYPFDHILTGPMGGDSVYVPSSRDLSRFLSSGAYRGKKAWESITEEVDKRLEEWIYAVIEDVKEVLELGDLEKDKWAVLDYLKTNYRANNPPDAYDKMEQAVWDWYTASAIYESLNENLCAFAKKELGLAGLFDKDSDYDGMLGEAVMELMQVFSGQGHSGCSAAMTMAIFDKLADWKPLTELTDNADEWNDISEYQGGKPGWQSSRSPSCFSEDGGKTYWDIDEDYYKHTDENGDVWSGGLSEEEWDNRPIYTSKHFEEKEK